MNLDYTTFVVPNRMPHSNKNLIDVDPSIYELLVNRSGICLFLLDERGVIQFVNKTWEALTGISAEQVRFERLIRYVSYLDRERFRAKLEDLIFGDIEKLNLEFRLIHQQKPFSWVRLNATSVKQDGQPLKISGTLENIDKFKEIEKEVFATKDFYESILNSMPADVAVFSPEHKYLFLNHHAVGSAAIREWLKNRNDFDYCAYFNKPLILAHSRRAFFNQAIEKKDIVEFEETFKQSDGSSRTFLRRFKPIMNIMGEVERMIGYGIDITVRKQAEESLSKSLEQQIQLNEMKTRFISTASHEFRTPLATIMNSVDLIRMRLERQASQEIRDNVQRPLSIIESEIDRLTQLISNILTADKIDAQKIAFHPQPIMMSQIVKQVIQQHFIERKDGREVRLKISGKERAISGDVRLMEHILINLISNAFKYSQKGDVALMLHFGRALKLTVSDQGIGIPLEDQPMLFSKFFRGHNTSGIPGTGLGLNIVKEFVDMQKGQIQLESQLDKGTTFHLNFPLLK